MATRLHLHLLSDSTGETLENIAKAALAQYDDVETVRHFWPMVRTEAHLDRILQASMGALCFPAGGLRGPVASRVTVALGRGGGIGGQVMRNGSGCGLVRVRKTGRASGG